jgi:uncharacterized protein HemX
MARKCTASGCGFYLPDRYPLDKCPWHMAPGQGPVKIAAALAIAAAGLGGGFAYTKFRRYLRDQKLRKERRERDASASEQDRKVRAVRNGATSKSRKSPRKRKKAATKSKPAA